MSNNARKNRTVGSIVNIMAADVQRFQVINSAIKEYSWTLGHNNLCLLDLVGALPNATRPIFLMETARVLRDHRLNRVDFVDPLQLVDLYKDPQVPSKLLQICQTSANL